MVNAMGLGDFDIFLIPYKKPFNECVVNSIWYVEATFSG
jgi:hypothetical protein